MAAQLGISHHEFADYARRDQTRREHAIEFLTLLDLRSFRLGDWRDCLRVGAEAAWATDLGEPIVQAMLAHLHARRVLVLDAAVLDRIGLAAWARARQRTFQVLRLTDATLAMFCKYVGLLFTKARGRDERRFQATRRDVARTLLLFCRTIAPLKHTKESGKRASPT